MEDKRITKTKRTLKKMLIQMLSESAFEEISVKQLCDRAEVSRVTFYSHYGDKFELAEDIFNDMQQKGKLEYQQLENANNPADDPITSYCNLLDSTLTIYYDNYDFFRHTTPNENPYLAFSFYNYVLKTVELFTERSSGRLKPKYSSRQITSFLCFGLCGFVNESRISGLSLDSIRKDTKEILRGILSSNILTGLP